MARYTGPKHRLARREGINILEKESRSLDRRLNIPPGVHGKKGRKKTSEYGMQLREKQKLKRIYGLMEKQFRRYVKTASSKRQNTEEVLIQLLETRLDNLVFRLGFAKSRAQARQFVTHRHVLVDGNKVTIPSYNVSENQMIFLSPKILTKNLVLQKMLEEQPNLPEFLEREKGVGRLKKLPGKDDIQSPIDYQLVIEFYSR